MKLALSAQLADVTQAASQFFHALIHSEAEDVLDSKIFARSLVDLVKKSTTTAGTPEEEATLVELLFEIATKIKLDSDILPAWFYPERDRSRSRDTLNGDVKARKNQFPLFHLFVDFVHYDGSTGDFARTGLLYLTETASKSTALERWMIESDLAPQMASGLGALYSRLNGASTGVSDQILPPVIELSDASSDFEGGGSAVELQEARRALLSYLQFWQDTLDHCSSQDVSDTLLDHFQVLFVQQLLYPSLLESSDVEGGSTASVLLHLCSMLNALTSTDLVDRMLSYLLADPELLQLPQTRPRLSMSRRKSLDQLAAMLDADAPPSDLFSLLDLLAMGLKSTSSKTITATLKLITVVISKHHFHVIQVLPRTAAVNDSSDKQAVHIDVLTTELMRLLHLATSIGGDAVTIDHGYQGLLEDVQTTIKHHACGTSSFDDQASDDTYQGLLCIADCKTFSHVLALLKTFFANDTPVNILLTEVIINIASCSRLSLKPWILASDGSDSSNIMTIIADLAERVQGWRQEIGDWDRLLAERKSELEAEPTDPATEIRNERPSTPMPGTYPEPSISASYGSPRPSTPLSRNIGSNKFGSIDSAISSSSRAGLFNSQPLAARSPLRRAVHLPEDYFGPEDQIMEAEELKKADRKLLQKQIQLSQPSAGQRLISIGSLGERLKTANAARSGSVGTDSALSSGAVTPDLQHEGAASRITVSLNHVLTNAVILQEFILEIAALLQVRASLFGEVRG